MSSRSRGVAASSTPAGAKLKRTRQELVAAPTRIARRSSLPVSREPYAQRCLVNLHVVVGEERIEVHIARSPRGRYETGHRGRRSSSGRDGGRSSTRYAVRRLPTLTGRAGRAKEDALDASKKSIRTQRVGSAQRVLSCSETLAGNPADCKQVARVAVA